MRTTTDDSSIGNPLLTAGLLLGACGCGLFLFSIVILWQGRQFIFPRLVPGNLPSIVVGLIILVLAMEMLFKSILTLLRRDLERNRVNPLTYPLRKVLEGKLPPTSGDADRRREQADALLAALKAERLPDQFVKIAENPRIVIPAS